MFVILLDCLLKAVSGSLTAFSLVNNLPVFDHAPKTEQRRKNPDVFTVRSYVPRHYLGKAEYAPRHLQGGIESRQCSIGSRCNVPQSEQFSASRIRVLLVLKT